MGGGVKRTCRFGLNVSSELSEERSSEESEVISDQDEPVITIQIGHDLEEGVSEETIELEDSESEIEEVSAITEVTEDQEWELEEGTISATEPVKNSDSNERNEGERGNAETLECRVDAHEQNNGESNSAWSGAESVDSMGPPFVETVVSNDSSTQNSDESELESDDDSDSGKSREWDPV